ncbi:MAG: hypothetical protein UHJ11_00735, partial [Paludibacteraceae bacterium]|nr:hypothetical protein [Paludibacteraceae bacterium]
VVLYQLSYFRVYKRSLLFKSDCKSTAFFSYDQIIWQKNAKKMQKRGKIGNMDHKTMPIPPLLKEYRHYRFTLE